MSDRTTYMDYKLSGIMASFSGATEQTEITSELLYRKLQANYGLPGNRNRIPVTRPLMAKYFKYLGKHKH